MNSEISAHSWTEVEAENDLWNCIHIICYYLLLFVIICYYLLLFVIICYYLLLFKVRHCHCFSSVLLLYTDTFQLRFFCHHWKIYQANIQVSHESEPTSSRQPVGSIYNMVFEVRCKWTKFSLAHLLESITYNEDNQGRSMENLNPQQTLANPWWNFVFLYVHVVFS